MFLLKKRKANKLKFKVDLSGIKLLATKAVEPLIDPKTNSQKLNKDGRPMSSVQTVWIGEEGAEVINLRTPSQPVGISAGTQLSVEGVTARPWAFENKNGVTVEAEKVEAAKQNTH